MITIRDTITIQPAWQLILADRPHQLSRMPKTLMARSRDRVRSAAPRRPVRGDWRRGSGRMVMTADEVVEQLRPLGEDSYKKVLLNHGIKEPVFGVKIEDLKKFQ